MGTTSSRPERGPASRSSRVLAHLRPSTRTPRHDDRREQEPDFNMRNATTTNQTAPRFTLDPSASQSHEQRLRVVQRHETNIGNRVRGMARIIFNRDNLLSRRHINGVPLQLRRETFRPSAYEIRANTDGDDEDLNALRLPSIDAGSAFGADPIVPTTETEHSLRSSLSTRRSNLRFNPLRSDGPLRHLTSSLRNRRLQHQRPNSTHDVGAEDQATLLSRLLSIAAAATAATLMGDDPQALGEARMLPGGAGMPESNPNGEDGSFDGFLRALQNGRIASALREEAENETPSNDGPLNFFRMFRFASANPDVEHAVPSTQTNEVNQQPGDTTDGRMVPIIIVGIRSISPTTNTGTVSRTENLPPFITGLDQFMDPVPAGTTGQQNHQHSIDSILSPPQNGTSFRHRRRASMGGFGLGRPLRSDILEEQRDRRRERPWSMASSSSQLEIRPPPATPASPSPELSAIPSRNPSPVRSRPASFISSLRDSPTVSRGNSVRQRPTLATAALTAHTEEPLVVQSSSSDDVPPAPRGPELGAYHTHRRSDMLPNVHYPRFASGHPRRNGVVEPDSLPGLSRDSNSEGQESFGSGSDGQGSDNSRSWIIYVLGGSYPENHPILTTPSLFTENPTYEDMMLLSALLGPAKAPVATDEDVQSAGGLYTIVHSTAMNKYASVASADDLRDEDKMAWLTAVAAEDGTQIRLDSGQKCLVCLAEFEAAEIARKLAKCSHIFHKECIDQWLTQGRNSCPLCRAQGVAETPDIQGDQGQDSEFDASRSAEESNSNILDGIQAAAM